jgi:hypothetical protein
VPQEIKLIGRSMDGYERLTPRFQAQAALSAPGGPSARSPAAGYSSCSSRVLASLCFNPSSRLFLFGGGLSDCPRRSDCSQVGYGPSVFRGAVLVVRAVFSDCPP